MRINGTVKKPRITVFRSNKYIYSQAIDDEKRITIASSSSDALRKSKDYKKMKKSEEAKQVGVSLAKQLLSKKIITAVFDRNIYVYKGRVKNLAEGLREGGLKI